MDLIWAFIVVAATIAVVLGGLGWIGYTVWKQVAAVLEETVSASEGRSNPCPITTISS